MPQDSLSQPAFGIIMRQGPTRKQVWGFSDWNIESSFWNVPLFSHLGSRSCAQPAPGQSCPSLQAWKSRRPVRQELKSRSSLQRCGEAAYGKRTIKH